MTSQGTRQRIRASWQLARLEGDTAIPPGNGWIPAQVPGAVQLDWARAQNLPDYNFGQNCRAYDGLEDSFWLYRTAVPSVALRPGERLFLYSAGVDFQCSVRLGGSTRLSAQGLESPFELDVTGAAPGTPVEILLQPAPKRRGCPPDRSQASHVTKPAVSYGWDWHPRLIPLGLCGETYFEVRPARHLKSVDFSYTLAEDFSAAEIRLQVEASSAGEQFAWRLWDPAGKLVIDTTAAQARLVRPLLWWTHDHGQPQLYSLEVTLGSGDCVRRRVGFRRVRLTMHAGAWEDELGFPKSRNNPPITLELNGRPIFAKGSNWVSPDIFHGQVNGDTYRPLLHLAKGAHFNLLRCWGGAAAPKEEFFAQCDELGLLVWQEFPLACNLYPDDPAYLENLDAESKALIRRVRQHPCLALWVGGNELFNSWSRMTDQSLPLRLLNRNCYDLDPSTPFLPTAPVGGMGHGDYRFHDGARDIFAIFQQARCTAYSEFGCPGASPADYLRQYIPAEELWPPRLGTSWETHHGLNAWVPPDATTWLCLGTLEALFGPIPTLEDAVAKSAWLQTEGYKSVFEEARRQQPRCAMALNWCFNEPWPTAANNSIVNWPARPKPAYAGVQQACRPRLASAKIPRFQWRAGERFTAQLWLLNDRAEPADGGIVRAVLVIGGRRIEAGGWEFGAVPPLGALAGPTVEAELPSLDADEFALELSVEPQADWSSRYRLSLRR